MYATKPDAFSYETFQAVLTREAWRECQIRVSVGSMYPLPSPRSGMTSREVADALLAAIGTGGIFSSRTRESASATTCFVAECSEAARTLMAANIQLLRDWFPPHDMICHSVLTLLDMVDFKMKPGFESPLDLIFKQIETGYHWVEREGEDVEESEPTGRIVKGDMSEDGWIYVPTEMCRRDGVNPAEHTRFDGQCGLAPDEDEALGLYRHYKELATKNPLQSCAELVQIRNALARAFNEDEIEPEEAVREYLRAKEDIMKFQNGINRKEQPDMAAERVPEINAFERLYVASLKLAIEAANTSDTARSMYRQMLEAELTELASTYVKEA